MYWWNGSKNSKQNFMRQGYMLKYGDYVEKCCGPRKGSLMKTQTRILDNRLYYTRKIELHRKCKKSPTLRITPTLICSLAAKSLVLITVRRVHYGDMGKAPTTRSRDVIQSGPASFWRIVHVPVLVIIPLQKKKSLLFNSSSCIYIYMCVCVCVFIQSSIYYISIYTCYKNAWNRIKWNKK